MGWPDRLAQLDPTTSIRMQVLEELDLAVDVALGRGAFPVGSDLPSNVTALTFRDRPRICGRRSICNIHSIERGVEDPGRVHQECLIGYLLNGKGDFLRLISLQKRYPILHCARLFARFHLGHLQPFQLRLEGVHLLHHVGRALARGPVQQRSRLFEVELKLSAFILQQDKLLVHGHGQLGHLARRVSRPILLDTDNLKGLLQIGSSIQLCFARLPQLFSELCILPRRISVRLGGFTNVGECVPHLPEIRPYRRGEVLDAPLAQPFVKRRRFEEDVWRFVGVTSFPIFRAPAAFKRRRRRRADEIHWRAMNRRLGASSQSPLVFGTLGDCAQHGTPYLVRILPQLHEHLPEWIGLIDRLVLTILTRLAWIAMHVQELCRRLGVPAGPISSHTERERSSLAATTQSVPNVCIFRISVGRVSQKTETHRRCHPAIRPDPVLHLERWRHLIQIRQAFHVSRHESTSDGRCHNQLLLLGTRLRRPLIDDILVLGALQHRPPLSSTHKLIRGLSLCPCSEQDHSWLWAEFLRPSSQVTVQRALVQLCLGMQRNLVQHLHGLGCLHVEWHAPTCRRIYGSAQLRRGGLLNLGKTLQALRLSIFLAVVTVREWIQIVRERLFRCHVLHQLRPRPWRRHVFSFRRHVLPSRRFGMLHQGQRRPPVPCRVGLGP